MTGPSAAAAGGNAKAKAKAGAKAKAKGGAKPAAIKAAGVPDISMPAPLKGGGGKASGSAGGRRRGAAAVSSGSASAAGDTMAKTERWGHSAVPHLPPVGFDLLS